MISLEEALAAVRARCSVLPAESVPLAEAAGRVLSEPVVARRDQPGTDISMMDGYALRAGDAASPLRVIGEVAAGDKPWTAPLQPGEAARIFTGAPVPSGADCVVMQEQCAREGAEVRVREEPRAGQHIRRRGEELRAGVAALAAGTLLNPAELSLAAACGASSVRVPRRPRVAFLATGDELVPVGTEPAEGQITETNSLSLLSLARALGAEPRFLGTAPDDVAQIAARLQAADADLLVTTGGASVGDHDHAQEALERIGGALVFHTVAIRPGKPILFGTAGERRLLFGLPGNPAAATLGFELFVSLALRILAGLPERPLLRARLAAPLGQVRGLTFFPRGALAARGAVLEFTPGRQQSSMQIASWAQVNAVAQVPPGEGRLEPGAEVEVLLLGPLHPAP